MRVGSDPVLTWDEMSPNTHAPQGDGGVCANTRLTPVLLPLPTYEPAQKRGEHCTPRHEQFQIPIHLYVCALRPFLKSQQPQRIQHHDNRTSLVKEDRHANPGPASQRGGDKNGNHRQRDR